jgi:hypothetical protein
VQVCAHVARQLEERPQSSRGVLAAELRGLGPHHRGECRDLHGQVRARQRADRVALEQVAVRERLVRPRELPQGVRAALRVRVGLGLGHRRLAEQVERRGYAFAPHRPQVAGGIGRGVAHDEAVRHVPHAGGRRGAQRGSPRARLAHAHGGPQGRRLLVDRLEVAGQVAGQLIQRPARRGHVHEPEQGRAELRVLGRQLHRLVVERTHRIARARGQTRGDLAPDLAQAGLDVHRRTRY